MNKFPIVKTEKQVDVEKEPQMQQEWMSLFVPVMGCKQVSGTTHFVAGACQESTSCRNCSSRDQPYLELGVCLELCVACTHGLASSMTVETRSHHMHKETNCVTRVAFVA